MAKKSGRKDGKKGRKADRALLELGEDLLTAVHLHQAVQDDEVRAALASAHADLVQAAADLVSRIAGRFLEESGVHSRGPDRHVRWSGNEGGGVDVGGEVPTLDSPSGAAH